MANQYSFWNLQTGLTRTQVLHPIGGPALLPKQQILHPDRCDNSSLHKMRHMRSVLPTSFGIQTAYFDYQLVQVFHVCKSAFIPRFLCLLSCSQHMQPDVTRGSLLVPTAFEKLCSAGMAFAPMETSIDLKIYPRIYSSLSSLKPPFSDQEIDTFVSVEIFTVF